MKNNSIAPLRKVLVFKVLVPAYVGGDSAFAAPADSRAPVTLHAVDQQPAFTAPANEVSMGGVWDCLRLELNEASTHR